MEAENKNMIEDILEIVTFIKDSAVTKTEFNELKDEVHELREDLNGVKEDVNTLKSNVSHMQSQMVTKVYLDDKIAELRGDLISASNNNNAKSDKIVEELEKRNVLDNDTASSLRAMQPFPKPHRI